MSDEKFSFDKDLKTEPLSEPENSQEEVVEQPQVSQVTKAPKLIKLDERGLFKPEDNSQEYRIAEMLFSTRAVPSSFKNVPQILMALQFLKNVGLTMTSLRLTAIINGNLSLWGEAPKALCDKSGLMEEFEEFLFDKDYKKICFDNKNLDAELFGAYCRVKRKGNPISFEKTFTMKQARTADLLGKDTWKKYPEAMIKYKARGVLRDALPDVLQGIALAEHDFDMMGSGNGNLMGEPPQLTSENTLANKLIQKHLSNETPANEEPKTVEGSGE